MAYEIVDLLEQNGEEVLLKKLSAAVRNNDRRQGKKHEIWQDGFDAKECRTKKFIMQQLIYIHENPVRGKWKLCETSLDYLHSSARFYFNGTQRLFEVKDYREFVDCENMYE